MQNNAAVTRSLAILVITSSIIWTMTAAEKVSPCCVAVSKAVVNEMITDYRFQQKNLPCVKAVIFHTEKGQLCIDPSQPWVKKKIVAFRNSQKTNVSTTTVSSSTFVSELTTF